MGILPTPVKKAQLRLADIEARILDTEAQRSPELDFDRNFALGEEVEKLKRMRQDAADALTYAVEQETKAAIEAKKAEAKTVLDAYQREAEREMPSLLNKYAKHAEATAAVLLAIDAHVKRRPEMDALARKFGFRGVVDGETMHRCAPDRTIPAQFEERDVWEDGAGNRPYQFRRLPNGELVPAVNGYAKKREKVQIRGEQFVPGQIPGGRLCDNIRLMGLKGEALFPSR